MLRLKAERDGDERDEITREDVFPADEITEPAPEAYGVDDVDPEPAERLPLRGLAVAAGTFVPTFLLLFFALPYVLGSTAPARTSTAPGSGPLASLGVDPPASPKPSASEVLGGDTQSDPAGLGLGSRLFSSPPAVEEPKVEPPKVEPPDAESPGIDSPRMDSPRTHSKIEEPPPAVAPEPGPALPSPPGQTEVSPAPEPPPPEASHRRPTPPAPSDTRAPEPRRVPEPRRAARETREWTPAAAFTDREAAGRLASSIEKQGYPVEIRQDGSSARPWVVWIGAQPSGGGRRR